MGEELLSYAKINRPELPFLTCRERLFESLEECRNYPGTWISGPAGSGKTALMSSYVEAQQVPCLWYKIDNEDSDPTTFFNCLGLAAKKISSQVNNLPVFGPEHHQSLFQFSNNFFTKLFAELNQPSILVLDNYQEISEDIALHDLIIESFSRKPEGIHVVFVSRNEPSPKFNRLRANRKIHLLGWEDIRFSFQDYIDLVEVLGLQEIPERNLKRIYDKIGGWVTGLILVLEDTKKNAPVLHELEKDYFEKILLYFEEEVFGCQETDIKHFLLKTSLLPYFTNDLAQNLTGHHKANKFLSLISHHNLFTEKHTLSGEIAYRYHQIFRDFLSSMMADFFTPEELTQIKHRAARLLLDNKEYEEAAELFKAIGDLDNFIDVSIQHAPVLLTQGKHKVLEDWFSTIPQSKFIDNPWLYNWFGLAVQSSCPEKAREKFRKAFKAFTAQNDMVGTCVSWTGLVSTIICEWHDLTMLDPLIDWLEASYDHESESLTEELRGEVATCMTEALMIRRPHGQEIKNWAEKTITFAKNTKNIDNKINSYLTVANYCHWLGDYSHYGFLLEKAVSRSLSHEISPKVQIKIKLMEAVKYAWHNGDGKKCVQVVEDALAIAQAASIHALDHILYFLGACGAIISNDIKKSEDYLLKNKAQYSDNRTLCIFSQYYMSTWLNIMRGEKLAAAQNALEALNKATGSGYILFEALGRFVVARTLFAKGEYKNAVTQLACFGNIAESINSQILKYMFFLEKSKFAFEQLKEKKGKRNLQIALELGRQNNFINIMCWWDIKEMTLLCAKALEWNIETEYVKNLINKQDLTPAFPPIELEQWPWPLKIYTLGRFEIVRDGKPLRFKGKTQQKPLNMLKALVAFGGRNVSEFRLADALWPESDGDMQHQSLATTLLRLRRIIGKKDLIHYSNGHLSLDARYCWVDAWAFERLLSRAEAEGNEDKKEFALSTVKCAEKAICLYKGDFLPQVNREHWCINKKERLKSRFLRGVIFLGRKLEKLGEQEKAVEHYHKALDIEPLMEEFYQRLMIYYQSKGQYADAALLYQRCQKNFKAFLNVQPSKQTNSLYRSILSDSQNMSSYQE